MSSAPQETMSNGLAIQVEENLPETPNTAEKATEIKSRSDSFIEIIKRISSNSFTEPISTDCETSKDENDSSSKSSPEVADLSDKQKRVCIKTPVLLQYCTLFALCFNQLVSSGICYSLGILYISFRNEFKTTKAITALIISVCVGMLGFGGVFAGMLVNRVGVRWSIVLGSLLCFLGLFSSAFVTSIWYLFITLCFLFGGGCSLINVSTMVSVSKIFNKSKNSMMMLVTAASPVGTFSMPQLMKPILDVYAWRGTLIILSGLALNMCFAGFLSTYSEQPTTKVKERPKFFDIAILRNKILLSALLASSISASCLTVVTLLVVDFWKEQGNSMFESVAILTISSSGAVVSRFFFGICNTLLDLSDYYFIIFYCTMIVGGFFIAIIPQCATFTQMIIVVLTSSFIHGITSTIRPAITLKTVGLASYSVAYGLIYTGLGIGTTIATTVAGKISDITHSYDASFYSAGISETVTCLILFAIHLWLERKNKSEK